MGLHSGYTLSSLASGDFYKIDLGLARPPLLRGPQMPRWPITPSSRLPYYISRNWNYCLVFGRTGGMGRAAVHLMCMACFGRACRGEEGVYKIWVCGRTGGLEAQLDGRL